MKNHSLIIVAHVITKLELGGAQLNTIYTAEHLDPLRFDAYLISGPGGPLATKLLDSKRMLFIPALTRKISVGKDFRAFISLLRLFCKIRPHIVHTHSSKAGIVGRLAAFAARVPVIIHSVHGFSFSPTQPFFKMIFFLFFEKLCRPLTDHLIFVAASDIESARVHKLLVADHSLIRSGFPLQKFCDHLADVDAIKKKYNLPGGFFVCGVIAPFKPQKGLFHLLDIAARVIRENPAVIFFIAGDGEQRAKLESELRLRKISQNFRLPGFITDIENVMDCFDIGVSTALWEGLPQSLVQLRLKKKAVVASDIPGHREVIRDGVNGCLVPIGDHERFASTILQLAADRALRERWAAFADEDFSAWEAARMVDRQEELYKRLFKPRGTEKL